MPDQPQLPNIQPETTVDRDDDEREKYRERLREYLQDPEFRTIEGFPIGDDEAILALSDPPYYTACPNPFLPEIITRWQEERAQTRAELGLPGDSDDNGAGADPIYHREPFAADVSEGKSDSIYRAHSYHTKVPHKAIMRYILHYTEPGDIVFDGFCGTGMTGVAAQLCGDREAVENLGYRVDTQGNVYDANAAFSRLGVRKAHLVDLSPAATFIAHNYNAPIHIAAFKREARRLQRQVREDCSWMYETWHPHCDHSQRTKGHIHYTIWSDVFICPQCGAEMSFWDVAVDKEESGIRDEFRCPQCRAKQTKRSLERAWETVYDRELGKTIRQAKQVPVLINYSVDTNRHDKAPDSADLALIQKINETETPSWFPTLEIPEGDKTGDPYSVGITHAHHLYTRRNLLVLARLWDEAKQPLHKFAVTALMPRGSRMHRIAGSRVGRVKKTAGGMTIGVVSGTFYVPALSAETNLLLQFSGRVRQIARANYPQEPNSTAIATQSASDLRSHPDESIDYIFVDPPFGSNLMYSELNFLWEAWLDVQTNARPEAIINDTQRKGLPEYQSLIEQCFREFHRVLKAGRWITVEFHNSQNRVWNAIQEAMLRAGLVIADVRTFDKKQGSFNQYTATGAVKQDLIISAYKPRSGFERRFLDEAGTPAGAWQFIRQHLEQLPTVVRQDGGLETIAERQPYLLFDRMVAFHIQRGATVPLSAAEFYAGLDERFVERDGMYFLSDQAPEYDRARLEAEQVAQLNLFVSDEKSSIQWLRQQLDPKTDGRPQTYQEIQPKFLRQLHQARHEALPELSEILEQNFLQDEQGRWYVPDPNKASDLEKLREKALLREFSDYVEGRGRLRQFRTEAVRAGFAAAWRRRDFDTIVQVAERLPERVLQEDPELLMYYDNASLRTES